MAGARVSLTTGDTWPPAIRQGLIGSDDLASLLSGSSSHRGPRWHHCLGSHLTREDLAPRAVMLNTRKQALVFKHYGLLFSLFLNTIILFSYSAGCGCG